MGAKLETIRLSESQVHVLETRYGIRFPEDFKDYLMHCCPKDDFAMDSEATAWWPLGRIKTILEERNLEIVEGRDLKIHNEIISRDAAKYILFADYAIWCWAWAICCDESENRGKVAVLGGGPDYDYFVADSFAHFVEMYVEGKSGFVRLAPG